jgi:sirohydrochlorin ferrochelatase
VVGVNDAGALEETDGGFVRDDRELLKDVARSAYEWYGQTRRAMTVVIHDLVARVKRAEPDPPTGALYTDLRIGVLITRLGAEPTDVNSVVTKLAFDLRQGTITVTTQYAEFDPRAVVA